MPTRLIALLITAALVIGGLEGVRDNDASSEATAVTSPDRYCELSSRLDRAGAAAFRKLRRAPGTTRQDVRRTERTFVREHSEQIDALFPSAPPEIAAEVEVLVTSVRARGGSGEPPPPSEVQTAERTVTQFEEENCGPKERSP